MATSSSQPSGSEKGGSSSSTDPQRNNLAERLELLEARLRMPTVPHQQQQHQGKSILETDTPSQHSFTFDTPSHSRSSNSAIINNNNYNNINNNSRSNLSLQSTSTLTPHSSSKRRGSSSTLEVVNQVAEQHMRKVAALEETLIARHLRSDPHSALSEASHQTLQTSHRAVAATLSTEKIVKESPPVVQSHNQSASGGNPRALAVATNNAANTSKLPGSTAITKATKRKSTPVKREAPAGRPRKSSNATNTNTNNTSDSFRKRTRLHFAGATNNNADDIQKSPVPILKNSDSRSNPSTTKAPSATTSKSHSHNKAPKNNKLIRDFFTTIRADSNSNNNYNKGKNTKAGILPGQSFPNAPRTPPTASVANNSSNSPFLETTPSPSTEIAQWQRKCHQLEQQCQEKNAQLKAVANNKTILQAAVQGELAKVKQSYSSYSTKVNGVLENLMRQQALQEAQRLRQELASNGTRLGRIVHMRTGLRSMETWEEGEASRHLQQRREKLMKQLSRLQERERNVKTAVQLFVDQNNNKTNDKENGTNPSANNKLNDPIIVEDIPLMTNLDALEAIESVRFHLDTVLGKLKELEEEEKRLQDEKIAHIRALKRVQSEDASRFRHLPKLHNRYVLMALLGKGGFSEVWRAFDVEDLQEVAVKIHQLDPRWSDEKKENYTKHVSREYEIHRNVRHPRIVSLLDVFEIDTNAFATVLECCSGTDLETLLKQRTRLPERDARAILLQILSGVNYLCHPSSDGKRQGIIHYDLKPGNILFDENGDCKITDFGLSKVVADDPGDSMELTSQGAGTYWYLPPECFIMDENVTVRISNKVDVWSIGVIYFQILYGRRPFGHGQSQDRLLTDHTMLNAKEVLFPEEPPVSEMGKQFIRNCLQYDQALRPTIGQICESPYATTMKIS